PGANDLAFRIDALAADGDASRFADADEPDAVDPEPEPAPAPTQPPPAPARAAASTPSAPAVDPLLEPHESFVAAVAANRLLTPADASARRFLDAMIALDAEHPLTVQARARFSEELLGRANAAII